MTKTAIILFSVLVFLGLPIYAASAGIQSVSPNPALNGTNVTLVANTLVPSDWTIVEYEWNSSRDGFLGNISTLVVNNLSMGVGSAGIHNITLRAKNASGVWSEIDSENITIGTKPNATIDEISPSTIYRGRDVTFNGSGNDSLDGGSISYYWTSDKDGLIGVNSDVIKALQILGTHNISFKVIDNLGFFDVDWQTIEVKMNVSDLGDPVPIIPRYASRDNLFHAFNAPGEYGNYPCRATVTNGTIVQCSSVATNVSCMYNTVEKSGLDIKLSAEDIYNFTIGSNTGIFVEVGNYSIVTLSGSAFNRTRDYGTLTRSSFKPSGKYVPLTLNKAIGTTSSDAGVFYRLYRKENCTLVPETILEPFSDISSGKDFEVHIQEPSCEEGTCSYIGEIIIIGADSVGGGLFTFDYQKPVAMLEISETAIDLGAFTTNATVTREINLTNTGELPLTNISINTSSGLNVTFNKTFLNASQTEILKLVLEITGDENNGNYTKNAIVYVGSLNKSYIITLKYRINRVMGTLYTANATTIDAGDVTRGAYISRVITLKNTGEGKIRHMYALSDPGITKTFRYNQFYLDPGQTTTLNISIRVPFGAEVGNYSKVITIESSDSATTITVTISYDVVNVTATTTTTTAPQEGNVTVTPKILPSTWTVGTLSPEETASKDIIVSLAEGEATTTFKVEVSAALQSYVKTSLTSGTLSSSNSYSKSVVLEINAPKTEATHQGRVYFKFYLDNELVSTKSIYLQFDVNEDVSSIISGAQSKYSTLNRKAESLRVQVSGTEISDKALNDLSNAENLIGEANGIISNANDALAGGDKNLVKTLIQDANSKLDEASEILDNINFGVDQGKEQTKRDLKPVFIVIAVLAVLGGVFAALREGWIPLYKFPAIVKVFNKIKLGFLVVEPAHLKPQPRFAEIEELHDLHREPVKPPEQSVTAQPGAAETKQKYTPTQVKQWQEYYKKHPEYAEKVKQMYRSYYSRRYDTK